MNTQFLEIYRVDGRIHGKPLRGVTTYQLRLEYENCFNFPGTTACFFLVSSDNSIGREEALSFAALIAAGKVIYHHIDLSEVRREIKVKNGKQGNAKTLALTKSERALVQEAKQLEMEIIL